MHDRQTGGTTRISVDSQGREANGSSGIPAISADGRWIAFHSFASNLVEGDNNGSLDIFVHDRKTGTTTRASLTEGAGKPTARAWIPPSAPAAALWPSNRRPSTWCLVMTMEPSTSSSGIGPRRSVRRTRRGKEGRPDSPWQKSSRHSTGPASCLCRALRLGHILPVCSLIAPCPAGAGTVSVLARLSPRLLSNRLLGWLRQGLYGVISASG